MSTLAQAIPFNVEASLNAWMIAALQAFTLPAWLTVLPPIVVNWPEISAAIPCFSLVHIPVMAENRYQGRQVGGGSRGAHVTAMLEVSCWVSRAKSPANWSLQLRVMRDMVLTTSQSQGVVIADYYGSLSAPATTQFKINIDDVTEVAVAADTNPDVERARILIDYSYVLRSN